MFWIKKEARYEGLYKDSKPVHIFYQYEVKFNWTYIWLSIDSLTRTINQCIQDFLTIWIEKKWMYEDGDTRRLIREDRLKLVNNHINTFFRMDWCPKGIKVRNIKITHLV